jgi:hypothetical protein
LVSAANNARGVDDPGLATAQLGAGHPIQGTAVGQGRTITGENERNAATNATHIQTNAATNTSNQTINDMTTARQMALAKWKDEHEFVDMYAPDGSRTVKVKKSEVPLMQTQGYYAGRPNLDTRKADLLAPPTMPGAYAAPPSTFSPGPAVGTAPTPVGVPGYGTNPASTPAPPAATTAPAAPASPLGGLSNDVRGLVGLPHLTQHEVNEQGRIDAIRKNVAAEPAIDATNWDQGGAAQDAFTASGPGALLAGLGSHMASSTGIIPAGLRALGNSGQIAPETIGAAQRLKQLQTQIVTAEGAYGAIRPNKYTEQLIAGAGPQTNYYSASDARAGVGNYLNTLKEREAALRRSIADPTIPPAEVDKLHAAYTENRKLINAILGNSQQQQPQSQSPTAPQAQPQQAAGAATLPQQQPAPGGLQPGQSTVIQGVTITRNN